MHPLLVAEILWMRFLGLSLTGRSQTPCATYGISPDLRQSGGLVDWSEPFMDLDPAPHQLSVIGPGFGKIRFKMFLLPLDHQFAQ